MATASISGLASGLDTATIISQLMQLEASTQTKLKTRVTTEQSAVTALQGLNAKVASLATSAKALAAPAPGTTSAWDTLAATSSNSAITATASSSASPTSFTVSVLEVATRHKVGFTDAVPLTAPGAVPTSLEINRGGTVVPLTTDGTLKGLITAINEGDTGLRATAVKVGTDSYRLVVESAVTGSDQAFTLTSTSGPLLGGEDATLAHTGSDARISLSGVEVRSSTNTFDDVVEGVDITIATSAELNKPADVTVSRDSAGRTASVKSLVDSVNAILTQVQAQTATNTEASLRGVLTGDSTLRRLSDQLVRSVYPGSNASLSQFGLQVDRYGKLAFDEKKFAAAYAADPATVTAAFTGAGSLAERVQKVAEAASDKFTGSVTSAINGRTSSIQRLNESIANWDDRLALRRSTLERQYTALETALGTMQSQSSWLSSQIASLPSYE